MSRIDESYEGYDELGNPIKTSDSETNDATSDSPEGEPDYQDKDYSADNNVDSQGNYGSNGNIASYNDDGSFANIDFLREPYSDANFDEFFNITCMGKKFTKLAGQVHTSTQYNGEEGNYRTVFVKNVANPKKEKAIIGNSRFMTNRADNMYGITFFDAVYVFSLLANNSNDKANKGGRYHEDTAWYNTTSRGFGQIREAADIQYGNMMALINEFDGYPLLQGYLKEAYHKTDKTNDVRYLAKDLIIEKGLNLIKQVKFCSKKVYYNPTYGIKYIPYTDMAASEDYAEKQAVFMINSLRNIISDELGDESYYHMDDYTFWTDWAQKNGIKRINNDVATASGVDSIIDEIANRFRVLLSRNGNSNKKLKDDEEIGGNMAARERRASILAPGFDIEQKFQTEYSLQISQEDIEEMREISLGEWLKRQSERAEGAREPASILKAMGPFTIKSINNLYNTLESSMPGKEEEQRAAFDERKEASAFDFFATLFMASKDGKMETALIDACRKLGADMWFKFENTQTAKNLARTRPDMVAYMNKLGLNKDTAKLSLDMVAYKDTDDGLRNFVAIEYQGEQHYRPNATASISIDDLYNANFSQGRNGDATNWPGYWAVIKAIITVANGWYENKSSLNESQSETYQTDRKSFLGNCINALESAISGNDGGALAKFVYKRTGYKFDDGYEDTFSDWVRKDRPQDKKKPIKSSISHFADSYYRWWCELDTFIQSANDLSKFEKTNPSLFTIEGGKEVGNCGLFYVCPKSTRVIPVEVIGNAISNPYRAAFLSGYLSNVGINIDTINKIYHRTFRANGKDVKLNECISVADGKTTLLEAIKRTLG